MMLGARTAAWAKSGGGVPTAKDYVQDGLIAMWDGIENAGWGVHDPNATVWKDLVKGLILKRTNGENVWNDDSAVFDGNNNNVMSVNFSILRDAVYGGSLTIESVFHPTDSTFKGNNALMSYGGDTSRAIWIWGTDCNFTYRKSNNKNAGAISNDADNQMTFSSEGVYKAGVRLSNVIQGTASDSDDNLIVGRIPFYYTQIGNYNAFRGLIKSLRFYNRAISSAEIVANYAIDKARFNLP